MASTKKTTKVQAPVDERETFLSLRKSFAENEQDTQEKLRTLYELQEADNEIDRIVQLRGELPDEVASLEDEIGSLKAKCSHLEEIIDGYRQNIEQNNAHIGELDSDVDKYNKQLVNVANSREYDSINKEIENTTLLRAIAEKNIREAREAIEAKKQDIAKISDRILIREDDLQAKKDELAVIVESTAGEEEKLRAGRDACASRIDERTLSAYERIRSSVRNHQAVVGLVNEDSCGGCFSAITPQRIIDINSGKKLVICEHCGRIIVSPEM